VTDFPNPTSEALSEQNGTVIAVQANFYQVRLDGGSDLLCTRRTRLKKIGQKVMVGDRVLVTQAEEERGAIAEVLPRQSEFLRPPVANAQQILLLFALEEPTLDPWQLSRFLVKAESTALNLCLCLNKADLLTETQRQVWQHRLEAWGYQPVFTSIATRQGLDSLLCHLQDQITILAGPSGAGKSSLINALVPTVEQRVAAVSGKLQRGRHTTRHVELFPLPGGGLLADTPGFNQPDLDCDPAELAYYFPEARQRLQAGHCQFNDCRHRDEPNCAVGVDWERYEYYREFLIEAIARQEARQQFTETESGLKLKVKQAGEEQYEPKLETKKYRRLSRRKKHQTLNEMYENQSLEDRSEAGED
jgi:ribosome biogenesis GTPase